MAALRRLFPGAPVYTSMRWRPAFPNWDPVRTSFLQPLATGPSSHVRALPLMPAAFASLRVPEADLVVTSFHTFALWARVGREVPHLVYCHTPPRFLWSKSQLAGERLPGGPAALSAASAVLRPLDRRRAQHPTAFIANSSAVAERIRVAYGRPATVVHPPVDIGRFGAARHRAGGDYFVVVSRLVPYKQVGLALAAFAELGWPLVVVGTGRAEASLRASAPPTVRFAGRVPDDELPGLIAGARALVFPGEEDFGITLVEAMAAGVPVVALGRGGARDIVTDESTGILFAEATVPALVSAVRRAAAAPWEPDAISAAADRFSEHRFGREISELAEGMLR